jgi:calcineurin-like phosphoesterase family protein
MKIDRNRKVWFTSDYHLFHYNIIKFDNRPFKTLDEMHETILNNHNSVVGPNDLVLNLGDGVNAFREKDEALTDLLNQFNGEIYYLPGNHEDRIDLIHKCWKVIDKQILNIHLHQINQKVVLCHFPIRVWDCAHWGSWHLHGHLHGGCKNDEGALLNHDKKLKILDVGIMTNNYYPYSLDQIVSHMSQCSDDVTTHLSIGRYGH